jgi:hypothetical protein
VTKLSEKDVHFRKTHGGAGGTRSNHLQTADHRAQVWLAKTFRPLFIWVFFSLQYSLQNLMRLCTLHFSALALVLARSVPVEIKSVDELFFTVHRKTLEKARFLEKERKRKLLNEPVLLEAAGGRQRSDFGLKLAKFVRDRTVRKSERRRRESQVVVAWPLASPVIILSAAPSLSGRQASTPSSPGRSPGHRDNNNPRPPRAPLALVA